MFNAVQMYSNMLDLGNPGDPGPGAEAGADPELPPLLRGRPASGIWANIANVARLTFNLPHNSF